VNFPDWVTNDTALPSAVLVKAKKALYVWAACEKLRRLHNAGWKWYRGDALTAEEEGLLAAAFPNQWPDPPTKEQVENWLKNYWQPRQDTTQGARARIRSVVSGAELDWVDVNRIV